MDRDSDIAGTIAADLLRIGAVKFSPEAPFTWTSGLRSPVYCDNRLTIGHVNVRRRIVEGFRRVIAANQIGVDVIAGTATAGIPHAAWLAEALALPMIYVRSRPKSHGTGSRIEGPVVDGARVLVVEDLVSTGGSSIDAARAVVDAGFELMAVLSIFTYGMPRAADAFETAGIAHHSLTDIDTLVEQASRMNLLDKGSIEEIRSWKEDPTIWSERYV